MFRFKEEKDGFFGSLTHDVGLHVLFVDSRPMMLVAVILVMLLVVWYWLFRLMDQYEFTDQQWEDKVVTFYKDHRDMNKYES